jgi:ATP/maltotriose-dependent transcriptional regulator MalT
MNDLRDRVLEYFREMGFSSLEQCRKALDVTDPKAIDTAAASLVRAGSLRHTQGMGITGVIYEYVREPDPRRPQVLLEKVWRAMRLSRVFTAWDAAMYSGASLDYTKEYIRDLRKRGFVEPVSRDEKQRVRYRIAKGKDSFTAPPARLSVARRETSIQEALSAGWQMMRQLRDGDTTAARASLKSIQELLGEGKA